MGFMSGKIVWWAELKSKTEENLLFYEQYPLQNRILRIKNAYKES